MTMPSRPYDAAATTAPADSTHPRGSSTRATAHTPAKPATKDSGPPIRQASSITASQVAPAAPIRASHGSPELRPVIGGQRADGEEQAAQPDDRDRSRRRARSTAADLRRGPAAARRSADRGDDVGASGRGRPRSTVRQRGVPASSLVDHAALDRLALATPSSGPAPAMTTPIGSTTMLAPMYCAPHWPAASTYVVFSIARARSRVAQWSSLSGPRTQAAGTTRVSAPASTRARPSSGKRRS